MNLDGVEVVEIELVEIEEVGIKTEIEMYSLSASGNFHKHGNSAENPR